MTHLFVVFHYFKHLSWASWFSVLRKIQGDVINVRSTVAKMIVEKSNFKSLTYFTTVNESWVGLSFLIYTNRKLVSIPTMEFCGSGVILWNVILETWYEFHKCLWTCEARCLLVIRKWIKITTALLNIPRCVPNVVLVCTYIISLMADHGVYEVGGNDPGEA